MAHERWWIDGDRNPWDGELDWSERDIIGVRQIDVEAVSPMLLWDERLGQVDNLAQLLSGYFNGNTASQPPPPSVVAFETRGLDPLEESEFWNVIDSLDGRMWGKPLQVAARSLALEEETFVLRWAETAASKAHNLVIAFRGAGRGELLSQFGLHNLGAAIGMGQETYDSVVSRPSLFDTSWATDNSPSVIFLGQFALSRQRGAEVWVDVTTSFSEEHRLMLETDNSRREESLAAYVDRDGLGREHVDRLLGASPTFEAISKLLESDDLSADGREAAMAAMMLPPQLRHAGLSWEGSSWRGIRALVHVNGGVRVRIALASSPDDDFGPGHAARALEAFGGKVCSAIEVDRIPYGHPMNADFFTIKRKFRGTREEYLSRYVNLDDSA